MTLRNLSIAGIAGAAALSLLSSQSIAAEATIRAVTAFPKTTKLSKSFLRFVDKVNAEGKGVVQIKYLGGPEITPPREQPIAMKNGLFDMIYGPAGYYLGLFPEGDFLMGGKTPMQMRKNGAVDMVNNVMRKKMNALMIGRFDAGMGLYLFLKDKPKMSANGLVDLAGLKLRSSPTYRNFLKDLGGTPVIMRPSQVYTALERGVVDGMGMGLTDILDRKLNKFVKFTVDPPFTHAGIVSIVNAKVWDGLPAAARARLQELAVDWEEDTFHFWKKAEKKERDELKRQGMTFLTIDGSAAAAYKELFKRGPWARMKKNTKVKLDVGKLKQLAY